MKALQSEPNKVVQVPESWIVKFKNYLTNSKKAQSNELAFITLINLSIAMYISQALGKVATGFLYPDLDNREKFQK